MMMMMDELTLTWHIVLRLQGHVTVKKESRIVDAIGADSTGATGNFAPVLTQEPGQTLRFAPVPFMAVL